MQGDVSTYLKVGEGKTKGLSACSIESSHSCSDADALVLVALRNWNHFYCLR